MIEITIAAALLSCLVVALAPRTRAVRAARHATVGGAARRSLMGPQAFRRGMLTPVLGGPARMPQFRPAVAFAFAGAGAGASAADRFLAVVEAPVAAPRRRAAVRTPVAAAISAPRAATRTKTRRATRSPEAATR